MAPKVAPDPEQLMADCEPAPGTMESHTMPDGWVIHSETWKPSEVKAVLLHQHGWMESTQTLGMRRLAKQCLSRGIVLVAPEMHGHGFSLEKHGKKLAEKKRGCLDSCAVIADHLVEMAKIILKTYKAPLMIMGHSMGADGCALATRRIVDECKAAQDFAKDFNPGLVIGSPDRNAQGVWLYNWLKDALLPPAAGGPPDWTSLDSHINVGVNGRVFFGAKDGFYKKEFKSKLPATFGLEVWEGVDHDFLSADPKSMECIQKIFAYIDSELQGSSTVAEDPKAEEAPALAAEEPKTDDASASAPEQAAMP